MIKNFLDTEILGFFLTLTTCASTLLSLIILKKIDEEDKK